ncbi:MAG TPA: tRNA threonylcarbamoyladenosine dehydratase [Taishania sp.]|nr:tRNA threonylcarbamoyladenosine dehydratase [Taishania sp.]HNS41426.1 tRNA threonylcarbamoyladenosine dehydratase [Taishania sp.]
MGDWLERSELLLGKEALEKIKKSHVLVVGLGGVGSFAAEFICRSGVGKMTIIDGDVFDVTNKNRQLMAMDSTIGKNKAVVLGEKLKDINADLDLTIISEFVVPERVWEILEETKPDFVMDCIDSVSPKIEWIAACLRMKIRIITHLGAGGKMDPFAVKIARLTATYNCKLAAHLKDRLRRRGIDTKRVRAVFSSELQRKDALKMTDGSNFKKSFYGTSSYTPALFGLMGAAEVIKYLSGQEKF